MKIWGVINRFCFLKLRPFDFSFAGLFRSYAISAASFSKSDKNFLKYFQVTPLRNELICPKNVGA